MKGDVARLPSSLAKMPPITHRLGMSERAILSRLATGGQLPLPISTASGGPHIPAPPGGPPPTGTPPALAYITGTHPAAPGMPPLQGPILHPHGPLVSPTHPMVPPPGQIIYGVPPPGVPPMVPGKMIVSPPQPTTLVVTGTPKEGGSSPHTATLQKTGSPIGPLLSGKSSPSASKVSSLIREKASDMGLLKQNDVKEHSDGKVGTAESKTAGKDVEVMEVDDNDTKKANAEPTDDAKDKSKPNNDDIAEGKSSEKPDEKDNATSAENEAEKDKEEPKAEESDTKEGKKDTD